MKCKNCKHLKGDHQSKTNACPIGKRTRIGFIHYSPSLKFTEQ